MEAQSPKSKKFVGWWWLIHPCRCWAEPKHCGHFLTYMYICIYIYILFIKSVIKISSHISIYIHILLFKYIKSQNLKSSSNLQFSSPFFHLVDLSLRPPSLAAILAWNSLQRHNVPWDAHGHPVTRFFRQKKTEVSGGQKLGRKVNWTSVSGLEGDLKNHQKVTWKLGVDGWGYQMLFFFEGKPSSVWKSFPKALWGMFANQTLLALCCKKLEVAVCGGNQPNLKAPTKQKNAVIKSIVIEENFD